MPLQPNERKTADGSQALDSEGNAMGKGDTRHKPLPKGIPALAKTERRGWDRDKGGKFSKPEEDPRQTALEARARHGGGTAANRDGRKSLARPILGEPMGMVIARLAADKDEEAALWDVWCAYTSAMRTYRVRVLGLNGTPAGSHLMVASAPLEAAPNEKHDDRSEEERVEGAKESKRRWEDRLGRMYGADRPLLVQAESGMGKALWEGKAPTHWGRLTLEALRRLAKVIERER
jgi:hypothetical protein